MFYHLRKEFQCLNNEHIKVDTVKADNWFSLDNEDLVDQRILELNARPSQIGESTTSSDKRDISGQEKAQVIEAEHTDEANPVVSHCKYVSGACEKEEENNQDRNRSNCQRGENAGCIVI